MQNVDCTNVEEMTWWERNRKKVFIAIGLGAAATGGALLYRNWNALFGQTQGSQLMEMQSVPQPANRFGKPAIEVVSAEVSQTVQKTLNSGEPFSVTGHIRNLPETWCPSPEQKELAKALGIILEEHQTYVRDYMKNCA